jgi:hypothetical protein
MKIAINRCFGGFNLSQAAYKRLVDLHKVPVLTRDVPEPNEFVVFDVEGYGYFSEWHHKEFRADPRVIEVIEAMGEAANGACSELKVVDAQVGDDWYIEEHDGKERIVSPRREYM